MGGEPRNRWCVGWNYRQRGEPEQVVHRHLCVVDSTNVRTIINYKDPFRRPRYVVVGLRHLMGMQRVGDIDGHEGTCAARQAHLRCES